MNKEKLGINLILEVLLMFSIILAVLSIFLKVVILNKNIYLNILDKTNVYEQVKQSVYDKIDAALSAKNIEYDIKEDIITEDDIKREADNAISGLIEYLKTGENNVQPIDTNVYKQRIADILHSIIDNVKKSTNKELSFNDNLQNKNIAYTGSKFKVDNMMIVNKQSQGKQDLMKVEKLMTKEEAEARVRELLKQKGLTEEQAIQKAIEKGITEEQALKILAGYGITIDESEADKSTTESPNNSNGSSVQSDDNVNEKFNKETSSNSEKEGTVNEMPGDKSVESPLDNIANKLLDEAGSSIEKEVDKINLNRILESNKLQKLAKITSTMYKLFWLFMIVPIILIVILIMKNNKDVNSTLKYIRNAFLLAGLVFFGIFFGAYVLKVYAKVDIEQAYLKETISYAIQYFLLVLSKYGIATFVIGLLMFIPKIRNVLNK